jgi:hypothetical protein
MVTRRHPTMTAPAPAWYETSMQSTPGSIVETEDDPTPIVLIVAATLRRSERTPKLAAKMRRAKGNVALASTVDPQAATIRFTGGRVRVERGVAPDTDVTIATDVNRMADEQPPKPKVSGAATHLRLALTAGRVLEPPTGTWQDEARTFWAGFESAPRGPAGVRVVDTDTGGELVLGTAPADFEIHGTAHRLHAMFSGGTVFGQEVLDGNLSAVGSLQHLALLTGRSIDLMMGR